MERQHSSNNHKNKCIIIIEIIAMTEEHSPLKACDGLISSVRVKERFLEVFSDLH